MGTYASELCVRVTYQVGWMTEPRVKARDVFLKVRTYRCDQSDKEPLTAMEISPHQSCPKAV